MLSEGSKGIPQAEAQLRQLQPIEAGTLVMDGTWRFRWLDDVNYELVFVPDDTSNLPSWSPQDAITFENPHAILNTVMTHKGRLGLHQRRQIVVFGRARISADRFSTSVDADGNPLWMMRCLNIEMPEKAPHPLESTGG